MGAVFKHYFDKDSNTFSYLVWDATTKAAAVIDPVLDFDSASGRTSTRQAELIANDIRQQQLQLFYVLETHVHADHLSAAAFFRQTFAAKVAVGEHICRVQRVFGQLFNLPTTANGTPFDLLLTDGQQLALGDLTINVYHTPGHTPACVAYQIDDLVWVGDTLFMPDFGTARCDFPGGDAATLLQSIQRLFALPDSTRLLMCHDYGTASRPEVAFETTVGAQKAANIHVGNGKSLQEFVTMRTQRDATLAVPKLLLPSVQVNMQAGELPAAESNGVQYLKLPLNQL
jgi:glyoxylase-like metal-dependent hydrolase (beta-lactamase superfamily II)